MYYKLHYTMDDMLNQKSIDIEFYYSHFFFPKKKSVKYRQRILNSNIVLIYTQLRLCLGSKKTPKKMVKIVGKIFFFCLVKMQNIVLFCILII